MNSQRGFAPIALLVGLLLAAGGVFYTAKTNPSVVQNLMPASINIPTEASPSSTITSLEGDNFIIQGKYALNENQKIEYSLAIPKNGGDIKGELKGTCSGEITGITTKPDNQGNSAINGTLNGNCQLLPNIPFKTSLSADYQGVVSFPNNNISLKFNLTQPISMQSSIEVPFNQGTTENPAITQTSSSSNNNSSSNVIVTKESVTYKGVYKISDQGNINFEITFPRLGGVITGSGNGACQAQINGQVSQQLQEGKRPISGTITATCQPMVTLDSKTDFRGTFWGDLDDQNGKIVIIHNGLIEPTNVNGYLEASYNPS